MITSEPVSQSIAGVGDNRRNRTRSLRFTSSQTSYPPLTHGIHYRPIHLQSRHYLFACVGPYTFVLHTYLHLKARLKDRLLPHDFCQGFG